MFDLTPHTTSAPCSADLQRHKPLQQSGEFLKALRENGQNPVVLSDLDNTLVLTKPLRLGRTLAMVNRTTMQEPKRLFANLQEKGFKNTPIILSPDAPTSHLAKCGAVPLVSPAHVAVLAMSKDTEKMRAALHQKWRNRLTHGARQNLRLTRQNLPQDPNHWLFKSDILQGRTRGYQSWPVELTLAYARANKGQAKLFQAFEGAEAVAAILILTHANCATYHVAHSTERGKTLSAHNLLMWEALCWLSRKGFHTLELGVVNTEDASGLARFKLGTGAKLHKLGGTWAYWHPIRMALKPLAALDRRLMSA